MPPRDGTPSDCEVPAPWHPVQASMEGAAAAPVASVTAKAATRKRRIERDLLGFGHPDALHGPDPPGRRGSRVPTRPAGRLLRRVLRVSVVADAVDGAVEVVGDQQRAVARDLDVDGPADQLVVLEKTRQERLDRDDLAAVVELGEDDLCPRL